MGLFTIPGTSLKTSAFFLNVCFPRSCAHSARRLGFWWISELISYILPIAFQTTVVTAILMTKRLNGEERKSLHLSVM